MFKVILFQLVAVLFFSPHLYAQQPAVKLLSAAAFAQRLHSNEPKQIVDVRTPEEFQSGHIAGAQNINLYDKDFAEQLKKLDKKVPVMVYCKVGGRSGKAAKMLQEMGFTSVYDLEGGIMSWEKNKLPLQSAAKNYGDANRFTQTDFDQLLANNQMLLVDFHAPWCIPCRQMEPYLNKLANEYKGQVTISRINIDNAKLLAKQLNVESIPVITLYVKGKEVKRVTGLQTEAQLRALIKNLLKS